jgi:S1-C subfamily serine protease
MSGGVAIKTNGSGTFTILNNELYLLTNKHVLESVGTDATCNAYLPHLDKTIALSTKIASGDLDKMHIKVTNPNEVPINLHTSILECTQKPQIGDRVVILGYPGVGSKTSITATEGIISGMDGDYYVSSAKIEHGNSGGAAIIQKDNCFVGIPTLVVKGKIESLARILPI